MRVVYIPIFTFLLFLIFFKSSAQTLPVGTPVLEEAWRRLQISGEKDLSSSFSIRPVYNDTGSIYDSLYHTSNALPGLNKPILYAKGKGNLQLLPIILKQQYNAHHPYGWNDGSMIPARGYQAQLSAGLYSKLGPLTIQLQPELVFAQNQNFTTFPSSHTDTMWRSYYTVLNAIDNPERFGNKVYAKVFPGQSSVRLNLKKLSLGVSTENLWWGPGVRNSLIMTNNAPGFGHLSFNTTAPVVTKIGSFEWQLISGVLQNSGLLPPDTARTFNGQKLYDPKPESSRYLNGMVVTWQPKWTKGLYLGFSRVFYQPKSDIQHSFGGYLPVIGKIFKGNNVLAEDTIKKDQMISIFFRLVLPKERAEVYGEFGRNDHSMNLYDFLFEPEHSRAYTIGFRKIFETDKKTDFELFTEITSLQIPSTSMVREQNSWYMHHLVRHGYTNYGQVVGAGIGPGGSSQTLGLSWIKGIKKTGLMLERVVHNNDFYYDAFAPRRDFQSHWVDLSLGLHKNWHYKNFLYAANLSWIRSFNYQWTTNKDVNNFQANLAISYFF